MGFWSKLGKGLLKAAPFAAMAIPGIGPLASAAIQGGIGAANAKVSGGGWKDMLLGGSTGAALGGLSGGGGAAAKGLSPSKGFLNNLGGVAKQAGKNMLTDLGSRAGSSLLGGGGLGNSITYGEHDWMKNLPGRGGWLDALRNVSTAIANRPRGTQPATDTAVPRGPERKRRPGIGPTGTSRKRMEIRTPNLAHPLLAGRNEARTQFGLPPIEEMDYVNV